MKDIHRWLTSSGVLVDVRKPSRYIGKELNSIKKDPDDKLRFLLVFPDTYEIGMSHLGLKILYKELNDSDFVYAERAYLPWKDMIDRMKEADVPLYSMETYSPATNFDIVGITLQYELSYTNVLATLELAKIPIWQSDRTTDPLVIGGGPCTCNVEPVADFFDAFVIGDGEEASVAISRVVNENRALLREGKRSELLKLLTDIPGVYVPFLETDQVVKAVVRDLNDYSVDTSPIVPFMQVVHERAVLELMRGCNRGCRFCQAGYYYRSVRERTTDSVCEALEKMLDNTGYQESSLLSLSTMDYSKISELADSVIPMLSREHTALSLPSTRVDAFGVDIASKIASIRKTGLTFAPEAGTQRLRDVINKNITHDDIVKTVLSAISGGWRRIKLYFMIGLPTETEADVKGIVNLARELRGLGLKDLTVSVGIFVPKPHTPFQYARQITPEEAYEKIDILKAVRRFGKLQFSDPKTSFVEGILARGDRELSKVIKNSYDNGSIFDEWTEEFSYERWIEAMRSCKKDPSYYTGARDLDEKMPWDTISIGVSREYLVEEYKKALEGQRTGDCRFDGCVGCGVCDTLDVKNVLNKEF